MHQVAGSGALIAAHYAPGGPIQPGQPAHDGGWDVHWRVTRGHVVESITRQYGG